MASTQIPPTSIDPRRLQRPISTHTSPEDQDSYNDSIDPSFLSSYQSMKNSSSSSPSAMADDYPSGTYAYEDHIDYPILGDEYMDEALQSFQQPIHSSNSIMRSIEAPMDLPSVAPSSPNGNASSPRQSSSQQNNGDHMNQLFSPQPSRPMRPRTPQISISTDLGQPQSVQDINDDSFQLSRKDSTPIHAAHSPSVTVGMWDSDNFREVHTPMITGQSIDHGYFPSQHSSSTAVPTTAAPVMAATPSGNWEDEGNGRRGLDPESRQAAPQEEVLNFRDQRKAAEQEASINVVASWMAHPDEPVPSVDTAAGLDEELHNITQDRTPSDANHSPRSPYYASTESLAKDSGSQATVDTDLAATRNQVKEGQVYINRGATTVDARDIELLGLQTGLMRLENDGPVSLDIVDPGHQGTTANDAIHRFNRRADNCSLLSRRATWGTTRRMSDTDIEANRRGGLLKRLSFGKGAEKKPGFFNSVVNLARKNSNANKLKRNRSDAGVSPGSLPASEERTSATSLAPPATPSGSRRRSRSPNMVPRIETNVGDLLMPSDHSYHGHSRRASTSNISPTSSIGDLIGRIRSRSRSKSDVNRGKGLAEQWKREGGPPIAIPSPYDEYKPEVTTQNGYEDADGDDDDEEGLGQDASAAAEFGPGFTPSIDAFKDHILVNIPHIQQYLLDRLAHQQSVRYKTLLQKRIKHENDVQNGSCSSGGLCIRMGGQPRPIASKTKGRNSRVAQNIEDGSDSNPDNKLSADNFPSGIPMPPTHKFPAQLECPYCFTVKSFQKPSDWTKHIQEDIAPFTCTFAGCKDAKSFKRKADYVRHENEKHRHIESWRCNIQDCSHICHRKDNFQAHLVREHRMAEPKARTKADIQKATGYDAQFWARVDSCYVKSSAEATNAPCKFCGQSFSSFKKLSGHEAKHMEQISLPIIGLVESRNIDPNMIISPVGPPPTSQQPDTPGGMTSHASPFSQAYCGSHMSPGESAYGYPDPSPTNMNGPSLGHGRSQSDFQMSNQMSNQMPNYGMGRAMAAQQQGVHMPTGTAPIPIQNRYGSVSPAQQHANSFGEVSPMTQQLGQFSMGSQFRNQNFGHGASSSMSRSYQSSMGDASSPVGYPVTTAAFSGLDTATTSMPMTTGSYTANYSMPSAAPQNHLYGEIDPTLVAMGQGYGGLRQQVDFGQGQYADDTSMHRSRSDSNMMPNMHQQYQQQQFQRQQNALQQLFPSNGGFPQQQPNLHPEPMMQGRPRSTSGGSNPRTRGLPYNAYKMN